MIRTVFFRAPSIDFKCREIGLDAFGWNVENATLVEILSKAVAAQDDIAIIPRMAKGLGPQDTVTAGSHDHRITVSLDDGSVVTASLVIAADGRNSPMRRAAGIHERNWRYPQAALTTILAHERDHRDISTEVPHRAAAPCTLVPLPGRRSSLVWVTEPEKAEHLRHYEDAALARTIEKQTHSVLGRMTIDGPRGVVPMSGSRRRSLRCRWYRPCRRGGACISTDWRAGTQSRAARRGSIARCGDSRGFERGEDLGGKPMLARYDRGRRFDVRTSYTRGVDMLIPDTAFRFAARRLHARRRLAGTGHVPRPCDA